MFYFGLIWPFFLTRCKCPLVIASTEKEKLFSRGHAFPLALTTLEIMRGPLKRGESSILI